MNISIKGAVVTALVAIVPFSTLLATPNSANAQLRQRSTEPAQVQPVERSLPLEAVQSDRPASFEVEAPGDTAGGMPLDDPFIMHCLLDHEVGQDSADCLKDATSDDD